MVSIAAGMESDFSGSDCDIVYSNNTYIGFEGNTSSVSNCKAKSSSEVEACETVANGGKEVNVEFGNHVPPGNDRNKGSKFPRHRSSGRRPCLDAKSSQLLDDLRYAIMQGNLETTKDILDKGVEVDTMLKAGWTGLMYACTSGRHEIVSFLLENKSNPNYHIDKFTPMMAACASRQGEGNLLKCCSHLLQHGAQVDAHERHFTTPLMFAAREGHLNIVKKLVDHGVDVNAYDNKNRTALAWAATNGFGQIVRLLLQNGADPQIVDSMGQSPADLAYEQGHKQVASLLEKGPLLQEHTTSNELKKNPSVSSASKSLREINRFSRANQSTPDAKNYVKHGELDLFLTGLGFPELTALFNEHHLSFYDLLTMNEEDLEKLGIKEMGVRKKILEASKAVHKKNWEPSSLPSLNQCQYISCPDAVAMMANIAKHLKYISSTVIVVRQHIQSQPRILELAQDSSNVHDLLDEMEDSLKNVRCLNDELRFLKMHLDKIQDNEQYIPADLIVETVTLNSKRRKNFKIVLGITIVSLAIGGVLWQHSDTIKSIQSLGSMKIPWLM